MARNKDENRVEKENNGAIILFKLIRSLFNLLSSLILVVAEEACAADSASICGLLLKSPKATFCALRRASGNN